MNETAAAVRMYRARAERCYRIARECPDILGLEIIAGVGNGLMEKARKLERRAGGASRPNSGPRRAA